MIPALLVSVAAVSATASCPLTLPRDTVTVHAPDGWRGYTPPEFVRLTGFGLMAGPPETLSYLAPVKSAKAVTTWQLDAATPRWLYCTYDHGAAIQIARPLPNVGTTCTVSYKETKQEGITAMTATCR